MEFDLSQIKLSYKDRKKGVILPKKPSRELAEFIGILAGDGHVTFKNNQNKHVISISGNSNLDVEYFKLYVVPLIKKLFNSSASIYNKKNENASEIYFSSKKVLNFLKKIGYYKHKKEPIKIPPWIFNNNTYFKYFIRGLADTDFSIMFMKRKTKRYFPVIEITSIHNEILLEMSRWLKSKDFVTNFMLDNKRVDKRSNKIRYESVIRLTGYKNFNLWMQLIGFRNKKHLNKINRNGAAGTSNLKVFESRS